MCSTKRGDERDDRVASDPVVAEIRRNGWWVYIDSELRQPLAVLEVVTGEMLEGIPLAHRRHVYVLVSEHRLPNGMHADTTWMLRLEHELAHFLGDEEFERGVAAGEFVPLFVP